MPFPTRTSTAAALALAAVALGLTSPSRLVAADATPPPTTFSFEKARQDFKVGFDDEQVTAVFPFVNETGRRVKIKEVHTNCGCVRAETDKKVYEPGDSGTVEAVFKIGSFEGKVEKLVTVESDLPTARLQQLTVGIEIPTVMEITPSLTEWLIGEPPTTEEIDIKVAFPEPVNITKVMSSRANFVQELVTVEPGKHYKIRVTPRDTSKVQLAVLRIESDCPVDKHRRKMAFVGIVKERRKSKGTSTAATAAAGAVTAKN